MQIYLVGGAVRDQLLQISVKERDWVVVGATPEAMLEQGYKQVGRDFPVFLHPQTGEEYALARTERKTGKGYTGFVCFAESSVTLEEDLMRRDFTINAIAQDEQGKLIDPYHGQQDLNNKILRHVSPAFAEDPLRILRGARFSAKLPEFQLAAETLQLMQQMVAEGEVDALVPERVWKELSRALAEKCPVRFIELLRACGALNIVLPEIDCLFGIPQKPESHPEIDTGIHTLLVLQRACELTTDPVIRFAALVHDVGKGLTPKAQWPSHKGHEAKSVDCIKALCKRMAVPNDYRDLALIVSRYHGDVLDALKLSAEQLLALLQNMDALRRPERFQQALIACQADFQGRTGFETAEFKQKAFLENVLQVVQAVSPQPLLEKGLQGKAMAEALQKLRIEAVAKITHY